MRMHFLFAVQLAQIQSLGNSGARTPISHHQSYTDKLVEDALFPQGVSPPPHLNNLHSSNGKRIFDRTSPKWINLSNRNSHFSSF